MKRKIQCNKCKATIEIKGKKPKNAMHKIFPLMVDPNHFKHNCKENK